MEKSKKRIQLSEEEMQSLVRLQKRKEEEQNIQINEQKESKIEVILRWIAFIVLAFFLFVGTTDFDISWVTRLPNWVNLIFVELLVFIFSKAVEERLAVIKKKKKYIGSFLFSNGFLVFISLFISNTLNISVNVIGITSLVFAGVYVLFAIITYYFRFQQGKREAIVEKEQVDQDAIVIRQLIKRLESEK